MDDSPARVITAFLIAEDILTDPSADNDWPGYTSSMPDGEGAREDAVAVYDTPGVKRFRYHTGTNIFAHGFQVRIRAAKYEDGWAKGQEISDALEVVKQESVTIDAKVYNIEMVAQEGPVFALGQERGTSRRELFTLNCLVFMAQTT